MEQCANCQTPLEADNRFCMRCGRPRTSRLLDEPTSPSLLIPPSSTSSAVSPQAPLPEADAPLKSCPACGKASIIWAHFCGECGRRFAAPTTRLEDLTLGGYTTAESDEPTLLAEASDGSLTGTDALGVAHTSVALGSVTSAWYSAAAAPPKPATRTGPRPKGSGLSIKIIAALIATALVVTTGGVTLAYFLTRPQPVIEVVTSSAQGSLPAARTNTLLTVTGQNFSHDSSVAVLLDGKTAPGSSSVSTNDEGSFRTSLTVTETWRYGVHTLTATDARGYTTQNGVQVAIDPNPTITSVTSDYHTQDGVPVGAATTLLHITGKWFSYNSPVTFLLNGQPAPGNQTAQSDAQGNVQADLLVTGNWTPASYTLTARDAQGFVSQNGLPIAIVTQGADGIPGPNGSPMDTQPFTLLVTMQTPDQTTNQPVTTQETLLVNMQADATNGNVCGQTDDAAQPTPASGSFLDTSSTPAAPIAYTEMLTTTCAGSYQDGMLSYTQTVTSDTYTLMLPNNPTPLMCSAATPYISQQVTNVPFTNATTTQQITWNMPAVTITCANGQTFTVHPAEQSTWQGVIQSES